MVDAHIGALVAYHLVASDLREEERVVPICLQCGLAGVLLDKFARPVLEAEFGEGGVDLGCKFGDEAVGSS